MTAKKTSELILPAVKAGLNLIPIAGGAVASLLEYIPSATERAQDEFLAALEARLGELEGRINSEFIHKDEAAELFKSTYLIVVRTHRKDKLEAAARLLSNLLLKDGDSEKLSYTELDHFVRALDALSSGALSVFATVYRSSKREYPQPSGYEQFTIDHLRQISGVSDSSLLLGLVRELNSWNLLELTIPTIRTENDGNAGARLTALGSRFAATVSAGGIGR